MDPRLRLPRPTQLSQAATGYQRCLSCPGNLQGTHVAALQDEAKNQVDQDLHSLLDSKLPCDPAIHDSEVVDQLSSLIEDAEAIIATPSAELAETILATLDNFEEARRSSSKQMKRLYTQVLFILTRYSRQIVASNDGGISPGERPAGRRPSRMPGYGASNAAPFNTSAVEYQSEMTMPQNKPGLRRLH